LLARYPLTFYFVIAFVGTWIVWSLFVLSQNGAGLLPFRSPMSFMAIMFLGQITGPTLAAFLMTAVTEGKSGLGRFPLTLPPCKGEATQTALKKSVTSARFVINSKSHSSIRLRREQKDNYEAENFEEKDQTTREASARRLEQTGQSETKAAGHGVSEGHESRKEIGCPRYCASPRRQEGEEKTESLARTPRAAFCRNESQVGCQKSR
jgi:hypothetical protein